MLLELKEKNNRLLSSNDVLSSSIKSKGIDDFYAFLNYIKSLPYGRNAVRGQLDLVLKEEKGSCSSKHALVKEVANLNGIEEVKLILLIFKMNENNTPKLKDILSKAGIEFIPEAHCIINYKGINLDLTNPLSSYDAIKQEVLKVEEIKPHQITKYKVDYHRNYLKQWLSESNKNLSFEALWSLRERCIQQLSTNP